MASKGSSDYQAAVRVVNFANAARKLAGAKPWNAEQKKFAVAWYLTGIRAEKQKHKKGDDDEEES